MARYVLKVAYDGSGYHGWQRQEHAPSVQAEVERVLSTILREPVQVFAAGRTDTGVHATGQIVHFDSVHSHLETGRILLGSRALLPHDIVFVDLAAVRDDFHSRFDAAWRQYRYRILQKPSPFERNTAWIVYPWPDFSVLKICAEMLQGDMDFTSFCKADSAYGENRCVVHHAYWEQNRDGEYHFVIRANRFLHHMVRGLTGTMVKAARLQDSEHFSNVLNARIRTEACFTAPSKGLYLEEVGYPDDLFRTGV